jgi:hypothetical protein
MDMTDIKVRRRRISSFDRLRGLPAVFSTSQLVTLLDITRVHADGIVKEWRERGLIKTLGKRKAGIHYNLVRNPEGPDSLRGDALWILLGRPFVGVGGRALQMGGWTTQLHNIHEVCTGVTPRSPTVPTGLEASGISILPRPPTWMFVLMRNAEITNLESAGIPMVSPELALADSLLANSRSLGNKVNAPLPWLPDPDDVEIPDKESLEKVSEYMFQLGASEEETELLLEPYQDSVLSDQMNIGMRR